MKSFGTKRVLSLLVAVCMLVAMLPASLIGASAAGVGTVYSYKFHEAAKAVSGGEALDLKTAFMTDYTASQDAGVDSAEWMLVSATNGVTYSGTSDDVYGIFAFGTKGGSDIFNEDYAKANSIYNEAAKYSEDLISDMKKLLAVLNK